VTTISIWHRILLVALALVAAVPTASADDPKGARRFYRQGARHYDLGEYEPALREFKDAYRRSPDPSFLFNIGQCQRKLGHTQEAIDSFRSFLRNLPAQHPSRNEIEQLVAEMQREIESKQAAERLVPPPTASVLPTAPPPARLAVPAPAAPIPADVMVRERPPQPRESEAFYTRGWFWGACSAIVAAGVVTAVLLSRTPRAGELSCTDCGWMTYKVRVP
jgi:tetratricopeptide (TPR) repeat protein